MDQRNGECTVKRTHLISTILLASLLLPWLAACVKVKQDPEIDYLLTHLIDINDVPAEWQYCCGGIYEVPGAKARYRGYYGPKGEDEMWVNTSQDLILYPSLSAAEEGFPDLLQKTKPTSAWYTPEPLLELSQSDHVTVACMEAKVNGRFHYACRAVGQYGRLASVIYANVFPDGELTFDQFIALLEAVDRKLEDADMLGPE